MSNTRRALLLFAHGARDPRWARPFEAVVQRVRELQPGTEVKLAFLELMEPSLRSAAESLIAAGHTRIDVLPLFLGTGGHVRHDLPKLLAELNDAHPGTTLTLHTAVGETDGVIDAMARVALAVSQADSDPPLRP
jgi:sirohydrochlorin cobaltochelatase